MILSMESKLKNYKIKRNPMFTIDCPQYPKSLREEQEQKCNGHFQILYHVLNFYFLILSS